MWSLVLDAGRSLLGLVYPPACLVCGEAPDQPASWEHNICHLCIAQLTRAPTDVCPRCAAPVGPHANLIGGCSTCRGQSLGFDRAVALGPYDGLLREVVLRLKWRHSEPLADRVGALWAASASAALGAVAADVVVPVPLHWRRRLWRGYNQSEALARALALHLDRPFLPRCLRRVRNTPHQTGLPMTRRRDNVRHAFAARRADLFAGRRVLLVDDVLTTGATAGEAARTLRAAGASHVCVAALARTAP